MAHALGSIGVTTDQLLFLHDEIEELRELSKLDRLKIVLVDHNNVVPLLSDFTHNIIRVIDHHKYVEPSLLPASCEKTIKLVGSCSSLVSQDWLPFIVFTQSLVGTENKPSRVICQKI